MRTDGHLVPLYKVMSGDDLKIWRIRGHAKRGIDWRHAMNAPNEHLGVETAPTKILPNLYNQRCDRVLVR